MDDGIRPVQPVGPAKSVRRLSPVSDFRRHLGVRLALLLRRMRRAGKGPKPVYLAELETDKPDPLEPPLPGPGHIDREA